jgi:CO/xanthine dehydrogenase FAD-binding subunit
MLDDAGAWIRAAEAAAEGCNAMNDGHASSWYRRELVRVQVERVLKEACQMASGSE